MGKSNVFCEHQILITVQVMWGNVMFTLDIMLMTNITKHYEVSVYSCVLYDVLYYTWENIYF